MADDASKRLDSVTDHVEEKQSKISVDSSLLIKSTNLGKESMDTTLVLSKESTSLVAGQFDCSEAAAEKSLRRNGGDVVATLRALTNE